MKQAVIVGAGIAGIASAIRLAVKGHRVQVFETNSYSGGKLAEIEINGFRFDAGPSLFTMPQYVDELFELAGKNPREYFSYEKLETVCHYFYEDGTRINAYSDTEKLAHEIALKSSDSAASVRKFLKNSARIYDITHRIFLENSLHRLSGYLNGDTLRSIFRFRGIDPFRTMHAANSGFFKDDKIRRFFDRYATYNGSDPYQAPATLNVIPHLEHHFGAYFPGGGMYSIVSSLMKLAEELGIVFHFNTPVERILVENRTTKGVHVKGRVVPAGTVVSNADIWLTYKKLLNGTAAPERVLKQERSSSALIFYWGLNRQFRELGLHNIFFSENYEDEFRCIWKEKTITADPTVYINISSKLQAGDAPEGGENWFVMINVPANSGQDWDQLIAVSKHAVLQKLGRMLGGDIASFITCEQVLDPRGIEQKTASYQGALYGSSSNSRYAAFLRHANFSSEIRGLYFAGGSVHPGGGIPLALLSAKIVAGMI